ncbi:DUF6907 domain-containing protein [Streptomyces sp. NPDC088350]|uniref:DUF6907 domain-containing protein n=1 Tax=Streptomyces sp. NPDC088350 TaxID=3365854 RepID=UPI0037F8226C
MNEEQRARKFVERHFPVTAAFLAAEAGEGEPPVFGPGGVQNAHDDQPEPFVVVRVAYRLSRFELFAALADGYATTNTGANPDDMTVQQIRSDVESYLCGASWRDMEDLVETVAGQIERGDHPEQMEALKRAMDRAYPLHHEAPAMQSPRYAEGTVTLQTLDRGEVTIGEPSWCTGHEGELVGPLSEVSHDGPETAAFVDAGRLGEVPLMRANLTHAPYLEIDREPHPLVYVEALEAASFDADGLRALVATGRTYLDRLGALAGQLDELAEEGSS